MHIPIHRIQTCIRKSLGYLLQNRIIRIEIIRIQKANHISRRHPDSFIHRIIDTLVRLTQIMQLTPKPRLETSDKLQRIILRPAINNPIFNILIRLAKHTLQRLTKRQTTVIGRGNN